MECAERDADDGRHEEEARKEEGAGKEKAHQAQADEGTGMRHRRTEVQIEHGDLLSHRQRFA